MAKTILVTGASSGIGEEVVKYLLAEGDTIYAGARRVERMRPLGHAGARLLALDVTDEASMTAAIETILQEAGRIDVLVNCAGYGLYGALEDMPQEEGRRQFEVNVFGLARLIQLVLPSMRARRSGRIINVSSIGGKIGEAFGCWYHASKFAVEGLSDSLRMELQPFGIDVVVIEPGATHTEWSGLARNALLKHSGDGAYSEQAKAHCKLMLWGSLSSLPSPPSVVAKTVAKAVRVRKPRTRYATAGGAKVLLLVRRFLSDRAFDALMQFSERRVMKSSV